MSRTTWELIIGIASAVMFVGTLAAIPWAIRRIPPDYFAEASSKPSSQHALHVKIARNIGGFVLIALGIAMLVLPGQGILTVLIGLSIIDLPIKRRLLKKLLSNKRIQDGVQHLRAKKGKPPLVIPA